MRIELTNVCKRFGAVQALDGVSFDVPAGHAVALVGPNGSGKSTLVRAIMGLIVCDGVRLDGLDPYAHRLALAARMAYVPQAPPQLGAAVGELVRAVTEIRRLDVSAIEAVADAMELDLGAIARQPVRTLSGGMKQKLMIALALAAPASLLVMDEPTASLETRARETFFRLFRERAGHVTLVLSSHRLDEIGRLVDRVIGLEAGRVVLDAPVGASDVWRAVCA